MAGYIDISPGGVHQGWIGNEPAWSGGGNTGAWFKKVWIGGTSPANAPFVADASGNVAINGNTIISGTLTVAALTGWNGGSINVGTGGLYFLDGLGNQIWIGGGRVTCSGAIGVGGGQAYYTGSAKGITNTVPAGKSLIVEGGIITGFF
jgi:hypothetical protein